MSRIWHDWWPLIVLGAVIVGGGIYEMIETLVEAKAEELRNRHRKDDQ